MKLNDILFPLYIIVSFIVFNNYVLYNFYIDLLHTENYFSSKIYHYIYESFKMYSAFAVGKEIYPKTIFLHRELYPTEK